MKLNSNKIFIFAILIVAVVFIIRVPTASAASITLYAAPADAGTHDCLSALNACDLQEALDAANVNNDDATINLSVGTFTAGSDPFLFDHAGFTHDLILVGDGLDSTFITNTDNGMQINSGGVFEASGIDFKDNTGSGVYSSGSGSIYFHDNEFEGNHASGLSVEHSAGAASATISGNIFDSNSAGGDGGGLKMLVTSGTDAYPITISQVTFSNNIEATNDGGGAYIHVAADDSPVTVTGVLFQDNVADENGGGLYVVTNGDNSGITIGDSDIASVYSGNVAGTAGGGVFIATDGSNSPMTIDNNSFYLNTGTTGGGFYADVNASGTSSLTVTDNEIGDDAHGGNAATDGAGGFLYTHRGLTFEDNTILNNAAAGNGGGVIFNIDGGGGNSTANSISNNTFSSNTSDHIAGGFDIVVNFAGNLNIDANIVSDNEALDGEGGGGRLLYYESGWVAIVTNNLFVGNFASGESGGFDFYNEGSFGISFINNTLTGNEAGSNGGGANFGFNDAGAEYNIENNIFWANTAGGSGQDVHIDVTDWYSVDFSYNDYGEVCILRIGTDCSPANGDFTRYTQIENIKKDPLLNSNHAYILKSGSPAINKGNVDAPGIPDLDLIGNDRVIHSSPDMGAYEFTGPFISVIGSVPASHLNLSPANNAQCVEGKLIKYATSPAIYVVENCQKRAFQSAADFLSFGYSWTSIVVIPDSEQYPSGPNKIPPTSPQAPNSLFTVNLSIGTTGGEVMLLQGKLQQLGFFPANVGPNGIFGPITLQAVIAFQKANGLPTTGFVGPLTRAKLNSM